jgi:hypothetical protein
MFIFASFHEEINEICKYLNSNLKIKSLLSKNISQFLLFVLMLVIMALYGNCVAKNNISDAIFKQYVIGDYILDITGILASISAIIISISILIIQHSVERQSSILLWLFVRDSRFYALLMVSLFTVLLLVTIKMFETKLMGFSIGLLYFLIVLNFVVYYLFIYWIFKIINPKKSVGYILESIDRNSEGEKDSKYRIYAIYEIMHKALKRDDLYPIIKGCEEIEKNLNNYKFIRNNQNLKNYLINVLEKLIEEIEVCKNHLLYEEAKQKLEELITKINNIETN